MTALATFPPPIRRLLGDFVARSRWVRLVRAALIALGVMTAWTLLCCFADRLFSLPPAARMSLLLAQLVAALAIVAGPLRDLLSRRVDWVRASEQIERRDASLGQRLVTVTSQLLTPPRYRGSGEMLDVLVGEVSQEASRVKAGRLVGWRATRAPALVVLGLLALVILLRLVPGLDLPRLLLRQIHPLADVPPVTTTQIDLSPGSVDLPQRQALSVKAAVRHLHGGAPVIHVSSEGRPFSAVAMTHAGDHTWAHTVPSLEADLRYYVEAGDARTPTHAVRVRRRPAIAEFRVRYVYPAYTGRPPLVVQSAESVVESPHGSEATVNVVATERLSSVVLRGGGGERIEAAPTAEPHVRQFKLAVDKDARYRLELISDRGVEGRGPDLQVRSVPDRPPLVRLLQPTGDLRLAPRDLVPLTFQALDDYGVERVWVDAQVNGGSPVSIPLAPDLSDPRRTAGSADIDLAKLELKVGDVVGVTVRAADKAGQQGAADPRYVLISPRSVDVATHQRIAESRLAADYAKDFADQLARAQSYLERAAKEPAQPSHWEAGSAATKAARELASAQDSAALLRQSLLRAIVHGGSAGASDFLAAQIDSVVSQIDFISRADQALASSPRVLDADLLARAARSAAAARDLAAQVKQVAEGDVAAAALADRANLKASQGAPATGAAAPRAAARRQQTLARARQEIAAALTSLNINPKEKDTAIDTQLQQRVQAAQRLIEAARPVDFSAAASAWVQSVKQEVHRQPARRGDLEEWHGHRRLDTRLEDRLYAASHAEALRPDADLVAARDYQISARAAAALVRRGDPAWAETPSPQELQTWRDELTRSLDRLPRALAALRTQHDVNRRARHAQTVDQAKAIHAAAAGIHQEAANARAELLASSGDAGRTADSQGQARSRSAEDLAMAANAYTATKQFDKAAEADRQLAAQLARPEIARAADAPRAIDRASTDQEKVAAQTEQADDRHVQTIAGAQRQVAEQVVVVAAAAGTRVGNTDSADTSADTRQKATEAITAAQEKLASLPMQVLNAQQLASSLAEVSSRLAAARTELADAPAAQRDMAQRALDDVSTEFDEVKRAFDEAVAPMGGKLAEDLAESLRPYAPESVKVSATVDEQLKPALLDLQQALRQVSQGGAAGDTTQLQSQVETAAQAVRDAVQQAQDALREAQSQLTERDPLVTARWFARQAAQALSTAPPNRRSAAANQKRALDALNKAAYDALRRSKDTRLSHLPSIGQLYLPPVPPDWPGDSAEAQERRRLINSLPGVREWGRVRQQLSENLTAPSRDADPPGYSDALRIYFEVLGREDGTVRGDDPPNR